QKSGDRQNGLGRRLHVRVGRGSPVRKIRNTIAGQFIALILGTVLLSQLIILAAFFIKTDKRVQEQQVRMIIEEVAAAYEIARTTSGAERERLLWAAGGPDIR